MAALQVPLGGRPATADDRAPEHAHELRQHVPAGPRDRLRREGRRTGDAARRGARAARTPRSSSSASGCGCTSCSCRRLEGQAVSITCCSTAAWTGRSARRSIDRFREDDAVPRVPVHRRGRRRAESAARLGRRQHGPAVESGRARTAHRPRPSSRPEAARAGRQLRGRRARSKRACCRC